MTSLGISGRTFAGIILAVFGALVLLTALGIGGDEGLLRWFPSLFIVLGLWGLLKSRFRGSTVPFIMLAVGVVVQLALVLDSFDSEVIWAIVLIAVGIALIAGGARSRNRNRGHSLNMDFVQSDSSPLTDSSINASSVLSSSKHRVESQEFRGGEVNAVMGSIELDMRDASVREKPARLEVAAVMGSVNMRVPSGWNITIDTSTVMGQTEDKRRLNDASERDVDVIITGSVVMGSLEIDD